ncbi:MAG: hypothetical protein IH626_22145 [Rhodospirillales bacterium]|nr:hypothetical protein [Rhodospirillales bacterium]
MTLSINDGSNILGKIRESLKRHFEHLDRALRLIRPYHPERHYMRRGKAGGDGNAANASGRG